MKTFAVALIIIPSLATAYLEYEGFNLCNEDGWRCSTEDNKMVVTFDCASGNKKSGRIWLWTARLPSQTNIFAARNCDLLELHVDCTVGVRNHHLTEFRVEKVKRLVFLDITPKYELLHDNGDTPLFPPVVRFRDISEMSVRSGLFNFGSNHEGQGRERNNCDMASQLAVIRELTMDNVTITKLEAGAIDVNTMHWLNVSVVGDIQKETIKARKGLKIENSRFRDIYQSAIWANGSEVSFMHNVISHIYSMGITAKAGRFTFHKNIVQDIATDGLIVHSSDVSIRGNRFNYLNKGTFQKIRPWYDPDRLTAYNLTYTFSDNHIHFLSPFALSCDWDAYQSICHNIILDGNVFQCDCVNLAWLALIRDHGFYKVLLEGTSRCSLSLNCTLSLIVDQVCQKDHNVTASCLAGGNGTATEENWTDFPDIPVSYAARGDDVATDPWPENDANNDSDESDIADESIQRSRSYYVDQTRAEDAESGFPVWAIIVIVLVLALIHGGGYFIWYATKKRNFRPMIHKYDNRKGDLEDLVVNRVPPVHMECENKTYIE